jgi:hypothetical protein
MAAAPTWTNGRRARTSRRPPRWMGRRAQARRMVTARNDPPRSPRPRRCPHAPRVPSRFGEHMVDRRRFPVVARGRVVHVREDGVLGVALNHAAHLYRGTNATHQRNVHPATEAYLALRALSEPSCPSPLSRPTGRGADVGGASAPMAAARWPDLKGSPGGPDPPPSECKPAGVGAAARAHPGASARRAPSRSATPEPPSPRYQGGRPATGVVCKTVCKRHTFAAPHPRGAGLSCVSEGGLEPPRSCDH